ncbi:MAG: hypothetical protein GWP91_09195 [Rhodobacterales bacterium]|nr:hypothetical protein [Rhodobacterales bacterium]
MSFNRSSLIIVCALTFATLSGCTTPDDPKAGKDMETLKKRVTKLENRLRALEGRARGKAGASKGGKAQAKGGKAPNKGAKGPAKGEKAGATGAPKPPPGVTVLLEGDAKGVMLSNGKRRFQVPGRAPFGELTIMATFSEDALAEKGKAIVSKDSTNITVVCDAASDSCTLK